MTDSPEIPDIPSPMPPQAPPTPPQLSLSPISTYVKPQPRPPKSPAHSAQIRVQNRRCEYLERNPKYFDSLEHELAGMIMFHRLRLFAFWKRNRFNNLIRFPTSLRFMAHRSGPYSPLT